MLLKYLRAENLSRKMKWNLPFIGAKETQIVNGLRSEDRGKRMETEAWLRQKYEREFFIGEEEHKIKTGPASSSVFGEAFQALLEMTRDSAEGKVALKRFFDHKITEGLSEVLKKGDYTATKRAENYLAKRLAGVIDHRKFRNMLPERQDREEAFFDSLLALIKAIKSSKYKKDAALGTYFHSIFKRACIGKYRNKKKKSSLPTQPWPELEGLAATLEANALEKLRNQFDEAGQEEMKRKLGLLKKEYPKCYQILYLYEVSEMSYAEIARAMKSTTDSIKTQAWKCRKKTAELVLE
ncbi:MAG: sigma-70 family RNA polymerase sigma factor [Phaeodactylibacter sp.]|nr:sigma-70 family RNA polymerase sigma factor [Phaeodactylibacter sp.]